MKGDKEELDVDYIGGEAPMTVDEEKELSEYFKKKKSNRKPPTNKVNQKSDKKT